MGHRAEELIAARELEATTRGLVPDGEAFWDAAWPWLEPRRWAKPRAL